ncbi:Tubby protein-like [Hondaea fermentalgiana]|uniref:Tubby protein-like n=1 Tax=Hondaea fermentalgiana TaxID=2315210 RepID=A0A2R5GJQ9_9STRA|nr:Tubby protein-like [Hondaea fermentalgiana]|eukprot:GBG31117.1 Tubby protein-like [Hondaea fermentalgiana]
MYSVPNGEVRDHYRGTWNAPIADRQHERGSVNYNTPMPETVRGADPNNPFDKAFAEVAGVVNTEIDPNFKAQLAAKMTTRPGEAAPAAFPGAAPLPARPAPSRAPPSRRNSYTGQMSPQPQQSFGSPQPQQSFGSPQPQQSFGSPQGYSGYGSPQPQQPQQHMQQPYGVDMQQQQQYPYSYGSSPPTYGVEGSDPSNMLYGAPSNGYQDPSMGSFQGGSFGAPSSRTLLTEFSDPAGSSTWDPFFGETSSSVSVGAERKSTTTDEFDDDEDDDSDSDLDDEEVADSISAFDDASLAKVIPEKFSNEAALRDFLLAPMESERLVKCVIMYDSTEKVWTFTNQSNGMRLMTAFKRTDGLKRLTTSMQWAISYAPRAVEDDGSMEMRSRFASWSSQKSSKSKSKFNAARSQDTFIAKMKSNVNGSSFEVFDTGLNPSKAMGAMHARRELGAVRIEKQQYDQYRRRVRVCIPAMGHNRRPFSKKDLMFERLAQGDDTVFPLANHAPNRPSFLPRLSDFKGMALASSIKNIILHNPADKSGDVIFVCGKTSKKTFNCYFKEPMSPAMAFAITLASISSYVNPSSK